MRMPQSILAGALILLSVIRAEAGDPKQELLAKLSSFGSIIGEAKQAAGGNRVFYFQMKDINFHNTKYPMIVAITCTNLAPGGGGDAYCSIAGSLPPDAPTGFPQALIVP